MRVEQYRGIQMPLLSYKLFTKCSVLLRCGLSMLFF